MGLPAPYERDAESMWFRSRTLYVQGGRRTADYRGQSHLPSFQPVRQRSSHLEQSNTGFPSFLLTSLWASHSHLPNSPRLPALTGSFSMKPWKSSAQTQQGYRREKSRTKLTRSFCWDELGVVGYVAAIEWRSVHVLRPRVSTSAGQSVGGAVVTDAVEGAGAFMDLARAEKAVLLEQARQLPSRVSYCIDQIRHQIQHTACRQARGRRLAAAASQALSQRRWHGRLPATHCAVVPRPCAQGFSTLL